MEAGDLCNFGGVDHPLGLGSVQLIDKVEHSKFLGSPQYQVDPFHKSNFLGLELSITPRHHYPGVWILPQNPPHKFTAFAISEICDRAGIEDEYIGVVKGFGYSITIVFKHPLQ